MDNRQKKCPTPEETVSGTGVVMKVICRPVKGRADYSKFIPALQQVSGYSYDEFTTKLLQKKKFLFEDWLKTATAFKFITKLEHRVLAFLSERTLRYGKLAEIVTRAQFLGGFINNGHMEVGPAVSNARQWYQAIHSLMEKGFVATTAITDGVRHYHTVYTLVIDAMLSLQGALEMSKLKVSKKYYAHDHSPGKNDTTLPPAPQCQNALLNKRSKNEITETTTACAHTRMRVRRVRGRGNALECKQEAQRNVLAAVERAQARVTERRESKAKKNVNDPKSITMTSLNAVWQKVMLESYGTAVTAIGLTMREFGVFKSVIKGHHISFAWEDFLRWCVTSWRFIANDQRQRQAYALKMAGKTDKDIQGLPVNPSLSDIVKRFAMFAKRYTGSTYLGAPTGDVQLEKAALHALEERATRAERELVQAQGTIKRLQLVHTTTTKTQAAPLGRVKSDKDIFVDDELYDWPMEG